MVYQGKQASSSRPIRGQIAPDMFEEMLSIARKKHKEVAPALEIGYRAALRPHEVMSLKKGCYQSGSLHIPDKTANARNHRPRTTQKEIIDPVARFMLEGLEEFTSGDYWAFNVKKYRDIFKKIAQELEWDEKYPNIIFDGPHCLRHGGMLHIETILDQSATPTPVKLQKMQISSSNIRRYTKPNHTRSN
ncbi:Hypothetical protein, putative [Bodo saltans]|uniref:Uncharacterized protein n=1 Tax=Bodo saltans TaxID=75058 RepID=A0A0S4J865_BODSA|nr:Hypothetical protein, putative [Bodo saltans]|eukprot:CUG86515.1 Hypothetical protein, putative [Bodo saltans]